MALLTTRKILGLYIEKSGDVFVCSMRDNTGQQLKFTRQNLSDIFEFALVHTITQRFLEDTNNGHR